MRVVNSIPGSPFPVVTSGAGPKATEIPERGDAVKRGIRNNGIKK